MHTSPTTLRKQTRVYVIKPGDVGGLMREAAGGGRLALHLARVDVDTCAKVHGAPNGESRECLFCGQPLRGPVATCVMSFPEETIGSGLCSECADLSGERFSVEVETAFKIIRPGGRVVRVTA